MAQESTIENRQRIKKKTIVFTHRFLRKQRKLRCPRCGKYKLAAFYDITTGRPFDGNTFGVCDRVINCGYKRVPKRQDYIDRNLWTEYWEDEPLPVPKVTERVAQIIAEETDDEFDAIDPKLVFESVSHSKKDISLYKYLCKLFPEILVQEVFSEYLVGYCEAYGGSPVFWQVDSDGCVRSGKVMGYNCDTGKRVKDPYPQIYYLHAVDKKLRDGFSSGFQYMQCLFGEHLIEKFTNINVVESEKSALICRLYSKLRGREGELWVATGGLENIRNSLFRILEGQQVKLYPDKGLAVDRWRKRIHDKISKDIREKFKVMNALKEISWLSEGDDIADYVIGKRELEINHKEV